MNFGTKSTARFMVKNLNALPYIIVIVVVCTAFGVLASFLTDFPLWFVIVGITGCALFEIAVDGLSSGVAHKFIDRVNPMSRFFNVGRKEKNFWGRFGAKRLKKFVPDLGFLVKFPKGQIVDPKSPEYVKKYLDETCVGEIGHYMGATLGFAVLLFSFMFDDALDFFLFMGLPTAITNLVLSLLPPIVLRFNR